MRLAELIADVDPSDLDNRDPDFIRTYALPVLDFLRDYYFRADAQRQELVPREGSFIAVANHNGGPLLPDLWVMLSFWWSLFGAERPAYALVHDLPLRIPVVRNILTKLGALRARAENGTRVLERRAPLLIYPGGELDCLKSFRRRHVVDFRGRTGFIKLAVTHGVPVVPIVNVGGHEVYFTVFSSRRLAEWTGLARLTRVRTIPLQIGLPWGVWLSGFLPYIPLPAKFTYRVGEPIDLGHDPDAARNEVFVRRAYERVTATMQVMLDDLARSRRLPVLG